MFQLQVYLPVASLHLRCGFGINEGIVRYVTKHWPFRSVSIAAVGRHWAGGPSPDARHDRLAELQPRLYSRTIGPGVGYLGHGSIHLSSSKDLMPSGLILDRFEWLEQFQFLNCSRTIEFSAGSYGRSGAPIFRRRKQKPQVGRASASLIFQNHRSWGWLPLAWRHLSFASKAIIHLSYMKKALLISPGPQSDCQRWPRYPQLR